MQNLPVSVSCLYCKRIREHLVLCPYSVTVIYRRGYLLRQMEAQRRPLYLAAADAVIPNNGTLDDALHAAMEALDEIFDS